MSQLAFEKLSLRASTAMKEEPVEALVYQVQDTAQRLKTSFPSLPKAAIDDLSMLTHFINPKCDSWRTARTIDSFVRNLAENGTPLSVDQFVEIVRTYAHAEDVPLYVEMFARTVKNDSGPGQGSR